MATKRDRKTAFPFIKPKGSIKKDVQQYRKAVMSQNGDDAEVRDAMINPVQRRESSASRFLKHFRPDRNNPAYHSEGKGLRKRRNWTSERQLTTNGDNPAVGSTPSANDPATGQQKPAANANAPQRSHSFSEPDASGVVAAAARTAFKEASGMRESFRWRFSSKSSKASSSSSEVSSKGGDTCKSLNAETSQTTLTRTTATPSSGGQDNHSSETTSPCNSNPPAAVNNWSQLHHLPGGHFNNKSPSKKPPSTTTMHDSSSSTVVDGRTSGVHVQLQQEYLAGHQASSPSEPIYSNGKAQPTTAVASRVSYYASPGGGADADYVNYEMFASHQFSGSWSGHQKQLEPDLIRNLPYQQQQCASTVATPVHSNGPSKQHGNNAPFIANQSPHRHSNRVHPASGSTEVQQQGLRCKDSPYPAGLTPGRVGCRDAQPADRSLYSPVSPTNSYVNMQHFPAASGTSTSNNTSPGYVPYSRPPAPLPEAAMLVEDQQQQQHYPVSPMQSLSMSSPSWQWPDTSATSSAAAQAQADDEETHYASQLRSSMAALLHGHIRQSSTASNASSTFSSYSDEFRSPTEPSASVATLGIPSAAAINRYAPSSGPACESGYETYADVGGCYGSYNSNATAGHPSSSPPPPLPPVRDASSLKYVKYGPGHEKHPSWPMPNNSGMAANHPQQAGPQQAGSQRSKSWTEQTDYPKEPAASYARPVPSVRPAYSQQLKTVMENCERIPPEVYQATAAGSDHHMMDPRAGYILPSYDCDGRNIDDKDYTIPSPPERDISGPRLTLYNAANASGAGGVTDRPGSTSDGSGAGDYAKYDDIQQYSHSEGYSSYVPSESSYVSVSGTPLLDQLRRCDSDDRSHESAGGAGAQIGAFKEAQQSGGRDSVSTVVTHSSSNSSNETLRWHGSYSDISVLSSAGGRHHQSEAAAAAALVVHSAKVQAPQRHNSESVLYYEQTAAAAVAGSATPVACPPTLAKTINRMGGWSQRVERKNQWNAVQSGCKQTSAALPEESSVSSTCLSSAPDAMSAPLSVAERIHQLEWQSRSVPNLSKGLDSPQRLTCHSGATASGGAPTRPTGLALLTNSCDPLSPSTGGSRSSSSSTSSSSSSSSCSAVGVASPEKDASDPLRKFTYLDPDKRMRVADPTLKAIQKQALLSYYERHAGRSSNASKSPPPPALPRTMASASVSPTHPAKNDVQPAGSVNNSPNSSELVGSNAALVAVESGGLLPPAASRKSHLNEVVVVPNNNNNNNRPERGLIPPERPPKKPHLRAGGSTGGISPDQEMRRIEASVQELMTLNQQQQQQQPRQVVPPPPLPTTRKPPAPDPPMSPPQRPSGPAVSPVADIPSARSASPDLPPPPPPPAMERADEEVADCEDPLPPPPPPHVVLLDERPSTTETSFDEASPTPTALLAVPQLPTPTMYHHESYMAHRKSHHSPNGGYHRRSADNLLESSMTSHAWEKHYNVRQGSSAATTLIFSSAEALHIQPAESSVQESSKSTSASPPVESKSTYISELTIQTSAVPQTETLSVAQQPDARPTTPQHTYRSLMNAKAERFNYLRQVSEGRPHASTSTSSTGNSKLSDPGPPKSLMDLNLSRAAAGVHQRSHSDSDSPSSASASIQPPKPPVPPKVAPPPRPKRPEEVECDQLSKDLINHLLPSDSRLHALLSVPDPAQAAACLRTEGLLEVTPPAASPVSLQVTPTPATTPTSPNHSSAASPQPPLTSQTTSSTSPKSNSCAPLPATSAYFTTSEPRAKLLTRYHSNHILNGLDGNASAAGMQCGRNGEPVDSELLIKKKEELVSRLARKLDVLRSEREAIQEEVEANELLGRSVTSRVACVATPAETNKVFLHVAEVDKITALLLALAGRLARAQNALLSLPNEIEAQEKMVLEGKRDKLLEQLEEAKRLKENIDRRSRQVSGLLSKYLTEEEFADYSHFVTMKAKLVIDQREIDEKIKLGDEQLVALRETLHLRPRV
ncbi:uncharacterized protein LOC130702235 isoform X2 [Daphnia carinata]|uniref:uncharacterized protein LOC130702235 isoform X2 n=1 Tax=Daphnia carinata TaxID=120202 RepID=UPI00257C3679|nr:uncharacterized protein LOC130702235 isoform X2 [Daphnia carinata]